MKKNLLVIYLLLISSFGLAQSQPSTLDGMRGSNIIGIKIGYVFGVNYEHYITDRSSVEADLEYDFSSKGITFMPLYKFHFDLGNNFAANVGGGVNFSWYNLQYRPMFVLGIDPTVGVDYFFNRTSIGVYYRPQLNISYKSNWVNFGIRFGFSL